jgi:hypothetical protein
MTTLSLKRGMVERYIYNSENNYFNIVDTNTIVKTLSSTLIGDNYDLDNNQEVKLRQYSERTKANFGVNKDVFNFFLKRGQISGVNLDVYNFV